MWLWKSAVFAVTVTFALCPGVKAISGNDAFWYQLHDGVSRLLTLTDANFEETLASSSLLVVWYHDSTPGGTVNPVQQKMAIIYENMLEMTSQFLYDRNVKVSTLNIKENPVTYQQTGSPTAESVLVFKQGRPFVYQGYRSAELLLSFIRAVNSSSLRVLDSKASKKEFDAVDTTKVLAFLLPGTSAYVEYEAAALEMHPNVPFFVVTDPMFGPTMKLGTVGDMYVIRPSDDSKLLIPQQSTMKAADIVTFVSTRGQSVFNILTLHNLHTFGDPASRGQYHVVAFSRHQSPEARPFYKALKHVTRQLANDTRLRVTVVDPDILPLMAPQWQAKFGIDVSRPALGLLNFTDGTHSWLDLTAFHAMANQSEQRQYLHDWLTTAVLPPLPPEPVFCLPGAVGVQQCIPLQEASKVIEQHLLQDQGQGKGAEPTPQSKDEF